MSDNKKVEKNSALKKPEKEEKKKGTSLTDITEKLLPKLPKSPEDKKNQQLQKPYFYISDGKYGCLRKSDNPNSPIGLCTDNFRSCNIFILKHPQVYILIHFDNSLNVAGTLDAIEKIFRSLKNFSAFTFRRESSGISHQPSDEIGKKIVSCCKIKGLTLVSEVIPDEIKAIAVTLNNSKPECLTELPEHTCYHDQHALICAYNQIDWHFGKNKIFPDPRIFDGTNWTTYSCMLPEETVQELNKNDIYLSESSPYEIFHRMQVYAGKNWRGVLTKEKEGMCKFIAAHILVYGYLVNNKTSKKIENPEKEFLLYSFNSFGSKPAEELTNLILNIREKSTKNLQNFSEFTTFYEDCAKELSKQKLDPAKVIAIDVALKAYYALFEQRSHMDLPKKINMEEKQKPIIMDSKSSSPGSATSSIFSNNTMQKSIRECLQKEDNEEAIRLCLQLINYYEQEPKQATSERKGFVYYSLGLAQLRQGKLEESYSNLEKAINFDPSKDLYSRKLRECDERMKEREKHRALKEAATYFALRTS